MIQSGSAHVITAQRYACAVYAVIVCVFVRPFVCHKSVFY